MTSTTKHEHPTSDPFDSGAQPWYAGAEEVGPSPGLNAYNWIDGVYFRGEYLNWTVSNPGDVLLGAPVLGNPDPRKPFVALDAGNNPLGVVQVPSTRDMTLHDLNGGRITLGAEFTYAGAMEVSGFMLERTTSTIQPVGLGINTPAETPQGILSLPRLSGTSTLVNGAIANNVETYNTFYQATYESQIWGVDASYYIDHDRDGFFQFQPSVGFRYIGLREKLLQRGTFRDITFADPIDTNTEIDSTTSNNLFGPQGGFRSELVTKYVVIGFENKIAFTANNMQAGVRSFHFRSNVDPEVITNEDKVGFSPMVDLGVYSRVNLTQNFSLRLGYNLMWIGRVTRPEDNVIYNDNGPYVPPFSFNLPDVVTNLTRHDIKVYGFNIGGEYRF